MYEMNSETLDTKFREAVNRINSHEDPFPADTLLKLYAYYKKSTNDYNRPNSGKAIINAFKTNALFQVENITQDQAKQRYIDLANKYLQNKK
jgi:acyl-CoA-binding protein